MPTPHNSAALGEIADVLLMPGDPLRAKYIADNYLEQVKCFNEVRAMYGYTGIYKGKKISVMGSGMGIPSMGIYAHELYKFYGVKKIIRIGSCGSYNDSVNLLDTVLVENVYSESNFALSYRNSKMHTISGSKSLNKEIENTSKQIGINLYKKNAFTAEVFDPYLDDITKLLKRIPKKYKCDVAEMEAYALFNVAKKLNKEAACLLSVVDMIDKKESISSQKRQNALNDMIVLALETLIK